MVSHVKMNFPGFTVVAKIPMWTCSKLRYTIEQFHMAVAVHSEMIPLSQGAEEYQRLRDSVAGGLSRLLEPERLSIPELDLQAMWFGGEFGRIFRGTAGETIEIVQFGHWNKGAGPDFSEVAARIDGVLFKGSVEIDVDCEGWEEHGHGVNPAFDDVILHLFLNGSKRHFFTRNSRHESIAQIRIDASYLPFARVMDLPEAYPGRCRRPLREMDETAVLHLLESAAQFRVLEKQKRLAAIAAASSERQMLFQAIAEALGFRQNKTAMAVLSQRNPLAVLVSLDGESREARLYGSAGFMKTELYDPAISPEATAYLRRLWTEWWKMRPYAEPESMREIPWVFSGSRPLNYPQRRIGALAAMVNRWKYFSVVWERPGTDLLTKWAVRCDELSHTYWESHYTLNSGPSPNSMKLVGTDRQRDILGNVILPWCLRKHPELWEIFLEMGPVHSNEKLRRAGLRLFGPDEKRRKYFGRKYYLQQGMLQIFQDFCLVDASGCGDCPFPEQLAQWK